MYYDYSYTGGDDKK